MSEASAPPPAAAAPPEQQHHNPHQTLPQVAMSTSGASNTSDGSSRLATTTSSSAAASTSTPSGSRAAPATALNAAPRTQPPPPPLIHQQQQQSPPPLLETLPSVETQRHIAEARAAVVASIGNMLDAELQGRAAVLHDNAGALARQERDVLAATEGLRVARERLAREADAAARRLKEVGNVQNWAEVLERGFLVLEDTVRRVNRGEGSSGEGSSWEGSECSCSDCGRTLGEEDEMDVDGDGHGHGAGKQEAAVVDKGKKGHEAEGGVVMDGLETMSETSRSLCDGESSTTTGTGKTKNSETASLSTTC